MSLADFNSFVEKDDFYSDCGIGKECEGFPSGCLASRDCSVALSYKALSASQYEFAMTGPVTAGTSDYIAVALSTDTAMGGDNAMACNMPGGDITKGRVEMYWNYIIPFTFVANSRRLDDTRLSVCQT